MSNHESAFNDLVMEALADVSEQVDEWQAVTETIENTLEWYDEELSSRFSLLDNAIFELDNDLAEQDHAQAEGRIDDVETAVGGVDALLTRMLVLKEITDAAASRSTLGVGEVSLRPALQGSVDLPKITTAMPEGAELDDEEWADAAVEAINDVADQIRSTGRDVESAWSEALGAVEGGDLQKLLGHTALLQAQVERLRAGYDEWYVLLGGLSNVAPHRLSGVASAEVWGLLAWLNS